MKDLSQIWIIVAVGKREKYLQNLLSKLVDYEGRIIFVNNYKQYKKFKNVHHIEDFEEINIYRWWNKGIDYAEKHGAKYVAILNDDLDFDQNFIKNMYSKLRLYKYAIVDAANSGNNGGAAWLMDLSYGLRLNESFRWWYGDTEIFDKARADKKFGTFYSKNFKHLEPSLQTNRSKALIDLTKKDKELYQKLRSNRTFGK
jgi:GT2 family glycosyltransferase